MRDSFSEIESGLLSPISQSEARATISKVKWKPKDARTKGMFDNDWSPPTIWEYAKFWMKNSFEFESQIQRDAVWNAVGDDPEFPHSQLTKNKNMFNFWLWGQGSGKSTLFSFICSYFILYNEMLVDFRQYYSQFSRKSIASTLDYLLVSCDKDNASDVILKNIKKFLKNTMIPGTDMPWWEQIAKMDLREGKDQGKDIKGTGFTTPKGQRVIQRATSKNAPEGLECFLVGADEVSHAFGRHDVMKTMIDTMQGNVASRYGYHGKIFLTSYPNDEFDPNKDWMRSNVELYRDMERENGDTYVSVATTFEVRPSERNNPAIKAFYMRDEVAAKLRYECISPQGKSPIFRIFDVNKMPDPNIKPVVSYRVEEVKTIGVGKEERKLIAELVDKKYIDKVPRIIAVDSGKYDFTIFMARNMPVLDIQNSEFQLIKEYQPDLEDIVLEGLPVIDAIIKLSTDDPKKKKGDYTVKYNCVIDILLELCRDFNVLTVYGDAYQIEAFSDKIEDLSIGVEEIHYTNRRMLRKMVKLVHILITNGWLKICGAEDDAGNNHAKEVVEAVKTANWKGSNDFISANPHLFDTFLVSAYKAAVELSDMNDIMFTKF